MYLGGQAGQRGYAMAALLMSVAVMAIVMSALLPVWRQQSQREKEAELAFRGEQYARAIYLFSTKNGGQFPPSIDALVQGRYLRKKYKDPMTEDGEFLALAAGANQPGPQGGGNQGRGGATLGGNQGLGATGGGTSGGRGVGTVAGNPIGGGTQGRGAPQGRGGMSPGLGNPGGITGGVQGGGGIMRVVSKSKEPSIRIYYGAAHYNECQFMYNRQGRGGGPGRGGPGGGPTQGRPGTGGPGSAPGGVGPGGVGPGGRPGGLSGGPGGRGGPGGARGGGPGGASGRGGFPGGRGGGS